MTLKIYGLAVGRSQDDRALYEFWTSAGPSTSYDRKQYPDAAEKYLRDLLPGDIARNCVRAPRLPRTAVASILCRPTSGAETVYYYSFSSLADVKSYYNQRLREQFPSIREAKGTCSEFRREPAERPFSIRGIYRGRRACFTNRQEAWVDWRDETTWVFAEAGRRDLFPLWEWWVTHAVRGARARTE
jgi:hypothetical protein